MDPIDQLKNEIVRSGLHTAAQTDDRFVHGAARIRAVGIDIMANVDPELDDRSDLDSAVLLTAIERLLAITPAQWQLIIDSIAQEIEEAVGNQSLEETTDLRDDLTLSSTVVFHDAFLLSFAAPKQFPDSWIRAQLDEDLVVVDVVVDDNDDAIEVVEFESYDDLLNHLSAAKNH
ncbi:MAG: hypothetical protein JWN03_5462 [Nocardia sp.]|uniref:cytochrome C5 n=1 Tax=Nocardia sp. TaxID=1821 RepID=UPI0026203164|nr:cytochrome C5 [Nocardia sp.]MCU1645187.1 hypothetical protein [Nocardia sp.]